MRRHEAHQKALAGISTLEKEIERLNCARACSQSRARSKSGDHQRLSGEGQRGDAAKSDLQMNLPLANPPAQDTTG